jgi:hypothetical protein
VNHFFLQKEHELRVRLLMLIEKSNILRQRDGKPCGTLTLEALLAALQDVEMDLTKLQVYFGRVSFPFMLPNFYLLLLSISYTYIHILNATTIILC